MAGLQLAGLASGLDWKSMTDQLMAVSRAPITQMRQEQTQLTERSTALGEIQNLLTAFQSSLKAVGTNQSLQQRTAALSNTSAAGWTASAGAAATTGSWDFNVTAMATAARRTGASDVASGISATNDVSGVLVSSLRTAQSVTAGKFTINGQNIDVATTDTLQEVFDKISTATAGAVTAAYDSTTDRVTLSGSGTITLGSSADTSNFLSVMKLFNNGTDTISSNGNLGVTRLNVPLASSGLSQAIGNADGDGNSMFRINGVDISYNVNTDSIQTIMGRINSSSAGVSASYDSATDRFVLTNSNTGNVGMFLEETGTGFLAATGLTSPGSSFQAGTNATFSINGGGTITSTTNVLSEAIHGITGLSVTAGGTGTQTVTVSANTDQARSTIDSVISSYNALQSAIERQTRITVNGTNVTSAPLAGNRDITDLGSQLRGLLFGTGGDVTSSVRRLADMGIDFSGSDSNLSVRNATLLTQRLTSNSGEVNDLFTNTTTGLISRIDAFISRQTGSSGLFTTQTDSLTRQRTDIDQRIADIERQLDRQRELLENSFIQMERSQSFWQQQGSMLSNSLPQASSSRR